MKPAPRPPRTLRVALQHVIRLVALFAWVGQVAIAIAPMVDATAGVNWAPHVESGGSPLHHAHSPNLCAACSAMSLVGRPELVRPLPLPPLPAQAGSWVAVARSPYVARRADANPRAPPM